MDKLIVGIKSDREISKALLLLRRVYNVIEMSHLTDHKMIKHYCGSIDFPRILGDDIFNFLQSKSQTFRDTTIERQKRFRRLKSHEIED